MRMANNVEYFAHSASQHTKKEQGQFMRRRRCRNSTKRRRQCTVAQTDIAALRNSFKENKANLSKKVIK